MFFDPKILKTKTFWTGVVAIVGGIGMIVQGHTVEGIQTCILGILAITGRDAVCKILGDSSVSEPEKR
jgi:hypothetical protein